MSIATKSMSTPHRYGTGWLVPSRSEPGVQYFVNAEATRCSCKGFAYRGACAHLRFLDIREHCETIAYKPYHRSLFILLRPLLYPWIQQRIRSQPMNHTAHPSSLPERPRFLTRPQLLSRV
jgi:hypothetical protein